MALPSVVLGKNYATHWSISALPTFARGFVRYKGEKGNFNSSHLYLLIHTSIWCHEGCHSTKIARGLWVQLLVMSIKFTCRYSSTWCCKRSWSRHQNCKRIGIGTKVISYCSLGLFPSSSIRIARGVPLPVYMNLDVYSGFWCTSHCVVF